MIQTKNKEKVGYKVKKYEYKTLVTLKSSAGISLAFTKKQWEKYGENLTEQLNKLNDELESEGWEFKSFTAFDADIIVWVFKREKNG